MKALMPIPLEDRLLAGAISVEHRENRIKPWRIPYDMADLFPPQKLREEAEMPAGVCVRFISNTTTVAIDFQASDSDRQFDCCVDDELVASITANAGEARVLFTDLPEREKRIEVFLSQKASVELTGLQIDAGSSIDVPAPRLRWVTYGSSITKCAAAASPAQTWPAIVARRNHLDLTCLGYGANCHMEPMIARMIRDTPADLLSVCLGINVMGGASLSARTFRPAVIGLLSIIREKHPQQPFAVLSPIIAPLRETTPNAVGLTLTKMRAEIEIAVHALQAHGDDRIFYVSGLELFNEAHLDHLPDNLHPDAEGYHIMAENYDRLVMRRLLSMLS